MLLNSNMVSPDQALGNTLSDVCFGFPTRSVQAGPIAAMNDIQSRA